MENEKGKVSKGLVVGLIVTTLLVVTLVGTTSYFYYNAPKKVQDKMLEGGNINLSYTDDSNSLNITTVPVIDDINGMKINKADSYFDFTVSVDLDEATNIDYEISVIPNKENTVPVKNIKVYLEKLKSGTFSSVGNPVELSLSNKKTDLGSKSGSMVIYNTSTKKSISENYRLRAWVDSTSLYVPTMTDKIVLDVEVHGKAS